MRCRVRQGQLRSAARQFPGKKAFINDTIEQVRTHLKALIADTDLLVKAAAEGQAVDARRCRQARRRLPQDRRRGQRDAGRGDRAAELLRRLRGQDQQGQHSSEDHRQLQRRFQHHQDQPECLHRRGQWAGVGCRHVDQGGGGRQTGDAGRRCRSIRATTARSSKGSTRRWTRWSVR